MNIFLAGATGAVGKRLVPLLVSSGHHVLATTRSSEKANSLRAAGSEAVVVDGLDRNALITAKGGAPRCDRPSNDRARLYAEFEEV